MGTTLRNRMIGILHAQAHRMGLEDDTYRDRLERITGFRSAADCSDAQLRQALDDFNRTPKTRRTSVGPHQAKIKALYLAAWNLGLVQSGTDAAIDAFVKRQCGRDTLAFVMPADAGAVTEGLKAMLARAGFVPPLNDHDGMEARRALLTAQWHKLHAMGKVRIADTAALDAFISRQYFGFHGGIANLSIEQLDDCAKRLGRWIRK